MRTFIRSRHHRRRAFTQSQAPRLRDRFSTLELLENRTLLSTYQVTTTDDSGAGSLRQAILDANASAGADTINFQISGVIHLDSALAAVTDTLTIDGTGAGVTVDGSNAGFAANGFDLRASNSAVKGLSIVNFNLAGVVVSAGGNDQISGNTVTGNGDGVVLLVGGNTVSGNVISANGNSGVSVAGNGNQIIDNMIGTDATGAAALGNGGNGVNIKNASNTTVRGNVISANTGNGVRIQTSSGNVVAGNMIGTDLTGTLALGNAGNGVILDSNATDNLVGGTTAADRNVISGNGGIGVVVGGGAGAGNRIVGNYIGTDAAGASAISNFQDGVTLFGNGVLVSGNVISGNFGNGMSVNGDGNTVVDNKIGTAADGVSMLGNFDIAGFSDGIWVQGNGNVIGTPGHGNVIAYNSGSGIEVFLGARNAIRGNSTFANAYQAIDLGADGYTDNDAAGHDGASNNFQNFPLITTLTNVNGVLTVSGDVFADANSTYTVDLYSTDGVTAENHGQGRTWLGSVTVTTDASGHATFSAAVSNNLGGQGYVLTTATDATGNTSEFSLAAVVPSATTTAVDTTTTLTSSDDPSIIGQTITLTAVVSPLGGTLAPSGTVTFYENVNGVLTALGTGVLSGGVATLVTSSLSVGTHTITAVYNGDVNFQGSTSNSLTETVKAPVQFGQISGHVYVDKTGNGLSADDTAFAGVTVKLFKDSNNNGVLDSGDALFATKTSAADGGYAFGSLAAGKYFVSESTPSGYVRTAPTVLSYYAQQVNGNSFTTADFDNYKTCSCSSNVTNITYVINGCKTVSNLRGQVREGDTVQVKFTVLAHHTETVSLVSYTAPGSSFVASEAYKQAIYNYQTGNFTAGNTNKTFTLTVKIPKCYFQVDFVCGQMIDKFGPEGSNIFYSAQSRLFSADNGGTRSPFGITPIGGTVFA